MEIISLHDRSRIETFFRQNPQINVYQLGDLDDAYWPYTWWLAGVEGNRLVHVLLFYSRYRSPVLQGVVGPDAPRKLEFFKRIRHFLPVQFHAHLDPETSNWCKSIFEHKSHGRFYKMGLTRRVSGSDHPEIVPLLPEEASEVVSFYRRVYPDGWFDPSTLQSGVCRGIRRDGRLIAAGGVHTFSRAYRVAALGNIVVDPEFQGQGLCGVLTSAVCRAAGLHADAIGLNVSVDNEAAIRCYERLGFEILAEYEENLFYLPAEASSDSSSRSSCAGGLRSASICRLRSTYSSA